MAINLKVALGGAAAQYNKNVQDEKDFLAEMSAKRRAYLLDKGDKNFAEIKKEVAASKGRVKKALNFGFSQEAALILETTGQLGSHLTRLAKEEEKTGAINKNAIRRVSKFVTDNVTPDLQADVLRYMSTGGYPQDIDELQDKFMTIMLSVTGDHNEAAKILQNLSPEASPIGPVDFQTRALTDMGVTERNSVIKNIQATISGYVDKANINDSGTWVGTNAGAAQRIQNEILQEYEKQRANPGYGGDIGDVLSIAVKSIQRQVSAPNADLSKITIFNPLPPLPTLPLPIDPDDDPLDEDQNTTDPFVP